MKEYIIRSKSTRQYYNIEDYTYLVECKKEDAKPNSEAMAKSFVSCNNDLEMEEV